MRIESIPEHALSPETDAGIGALMDVAFGAAAGYRGRSFHKMRHHLRVVGWHGGLLIGHVALHLRAIRMADKPLTIAGVGEVAVHPDHRGQGIGTALLREAVGQARTGVADFAVLFGYPGLYAPLGFRHQPNRLTYVAWDGGQPTGVVSDTIESLMVLPLGPRQWDETARIDLCGPLF